MKDKATRDQIRALLKSIEDLQNLRIRLDNRLKKKADGFTDQAVVNDTNITEDAMMTNIDLRDDIRETEDKYTKQLEALVKTTDEWKLFLKDVRGVGPKVAAVLISEIDPYKAETVSKIWQYAGLNAGMVLGKTRDGVTGDMIRGDKPTSGYLLPYNKFLKSFLLGVLGDSFLRGKNPKYTKIYYDSKNYYSTRPDWKGQSNNHIHRASVRKMVKIFLQDYYVFIRGLYGLEVRAPYCEEKMGVKHHYYGESAHEQN